MIFSHSISDDSLVQDVLAKKHHIEYSVHALKHWQRVERNGLFLVDRMGGDPKIVSLFALFHDSQRLNDFEDPEHGARGASLAREFYQNGRLPITESELDLLTLACTQHTDTIFTDDPTIQCCWDGDRLDLSRVGILPDSTMLNTSSAKSIADTMDYGELHAFPHPVNI